MEIEFCRQQEYEEATNERLQKDIGRLQQSTKPSVDRSKQVEASKNGTTNSGSKLDTGFVGHKSAKMMQKSNLFRWTKEKVIDSQKFCEKAHLYILDEPLNFIDIYSRMQFYLILSL